MAISGLGSNLSSYSVSTSAPDRAQKLLEQMDSDADGKVSKQELTSFDDSMKTKGARTPPAGSAGGVKGANAVSPPTVDEMFARADTDGDGSLSIENLSAMMSEHETHAAARGGHASGPPPGGPPPGGPPPGGAGGGAASADSSSADSDPADSNNDGTVSAAEKLVYEFSHPDASEAKAS